ncbi:MAG: hypothetical protein A4E53_03942 [Pelotomaculum sp. PtaB.Bin104]|nr:MAG: hypothetical protein A4E53_03942 [Pelotomaculum sp. PtaB.Bin104]
MATELPDKRDEIVCALATTIQGKIILPAQEKTAALKYAVNETNERIDFLENTIAELAVAHSRTKAMAVISILGLLIIFTVWLVHL